MTSTVDRIRQIENELARLPVGYISKKIINGKERFYLQWMENGKLKSKYIKAADFDTINAQVETRKRLQAELKNLNKTPEGIRDTNLKRKAARNRISITGELMSEDNVIASVKDGEIISCDEALLPSLHVLDIKSEMGVRHKI